MSDPIPTFVIVGAQKCGTTSLHHALRSHPEIHMSNPVKEPGYFLKNDWLVTYWKARGRNIQSRQDLLAQAMLDGFKGQSHFGESSTYYTLGDFCQRQGVAERMARINPDMRLIYVLRDPLQRIVSNYLHCRRSGATNGSLSQFMEERQGQQAVATSLYYQQIAPYLEYFGADKILLLLFDDLVNNANATLNRVCRFLTVQEMASNMALSALNVSENRSDVQQDQLMLPSSQEKALRQRLQADAEKLSAELGLDVSEWTFELS
ncbi:MAG: sulfotransferase [Oceanococcus sp.]|nr:MAG: sulfotransferase [Oceanococcus sp.]